MMRTLVIVLTLLGLVVGAIPLAMYLIDVTTDSDSTIVYQGAYEPLHGVTMSRNYESSANISFEDRSAARPEWILPALFPVGGAALGALTALTLGRAGWRLTRKG
ncbi:hypothetical protein [Rhodococcus sp. 27YEA15]|uniref:hypothetical protein n=1 Tax=Rhodococcus sp. 27YEA15 TaxID=3156259 RepID=UPI003C79938B